VKEKTENQKRRWQPSHALSSPAPLSLLFLLRTSPHSWFTHRTSARLLLPARALHLPAPLAPLHCCHSFLSLRIFHASAPALIFRPRASFHTTASQRPPPPLTLLCTTSHKEATTPASLPLSSTPHHRYMDIFTFPSGPTHRPHWATLTPPFHLHTSGGDTYSPATHLHCTHCCPLHLLHRTCTRTSGCH